MVMTKAHAKRKQDIKSKLMAAVAMLLVSSIMMVTSTYAWFTLSTAPEVTGITTAVGANGNLEMALLPYDGSLTSIKSDTGDSNKNVVARNMTWGNIVELGDTDAYGLNNIVLNPARLKMEGDGISPTSILEAPAYGSDGRISTMNGTLTGVYNGTGFYESITYNTVTVNNAKGVRAIGTSSGMSDRQMAFRAAISAANTNMGSAKRVASNSLNTHGQTLASIAVKKASNTNEFSYAEVSTILTAINDILGKDGNNGALTYIEEAMKYVVIAKAINGATDDNFKTVKTTLEGMTLAEIMADTTTYGTYTTGLATYVEKLNDAKEDAETAKGVLETALSGKNADSKIGWAEFSAGLTAIVDVESENMTVNGFAVKDLMVSTGEGDNKTYPNLNILINDAFSNGITMTMGSGSGVYADIADFAGTYGAGVTLTGIVYNGITAPDLPANMTAAGVNPTYLSTAIDSVGTFTGTTGAASALTDFYGYIIDLAFKTNVADSDLMLQTAAVDRIYADGTSAATMGGGSSMTFKTNDVAFGAKGVKDLMQHLKIVFVDANMKIIGNAKLDPATATTEADGSVTMDIVMMDKDGNKAATAKIMDLPQNQAVALSVLVYLDGDSVTNAHVANATQSMMGSMNIQFSSSAELVPMEYTPLLTGDEQAFERDGMTPISVTGNAKGTAYYVKSGDNRAVIYIPDASEEGATVTIKGQAAISGSYAGRNGLGITVNEKVTTVEINVTGGTGGSSGGSSSSGSETTTETYDKVADGAEYVASTDYYTYDGSTYTKWTPSDDAKDDAVEFAEAKANLYTKDA